MDTDDFHTDPQLFDQLDPEYALAIRKMDWREPSAADQTFAEDVAESLDIDFVTALRLEREDFRGHDYEQHRKFLYPDRTLIRSPEETVAGMEAAAQFLAKEVAAGAKLAIFADYDVDGTTSAHIMKTALISAGAQSEQILYEFASAQDGFGLTQRFVKEANKAGVKVLITVDCGSTQSAQIRYAKELGIRVVVVDHHNVDLENPADFHLNPLFVEERRKQQAGDLVAKARALLLEAVAAKRQAQHHPDDAKAKKSLQGFIAPSRELIGQLDSISLLPAAPASTQLQIAIERAERIGEETPLYENTGAQLTWKFGAALITAARGGIDDTWYGLPLYLAGLGALADMADMRMLENRAFVRVPIDEAQEREVSPVPPGLSVLAGYFDEDPQDVAGLIRTRAALNLAKRTPMVEGKQVADIYQQSDEAAAKPLVDALLVTYKEATAKRDAMQEVAFANWEERLAAAQARGDEEPYFAVGMVKDYPNHAGQSGVIAMRLARHAGRPAVVFTERGEDAEGYQLYKFSARNGIVRNASIGELLDHPDMLEATRVASTDEHGVIDISPSLGGHSDVVSGACREESINSVIACFETFAKEYVSKGKYNIWKARPRNAVWLTKRLIAPERLERLEQEAKLLKPTANKCFSMEISVIARTEAIEELDEDRHTHAATLVLASGETRPCDIHESAVNALRTGAFFEIKIKLGEDRYWIRDLRPVE